MGVLEGRRILVVGATRGIGRGVAQACGEAGARVVVAARTMDQLSSLAEELNAVAVACDARDDASCRAAVESAVSALGGLDAIIYAAGITAYSPVAEYSRETWQSVFETNVFGAHSVLAASVKHLEASGGHAIVLNSEGALSEPDPWPGIAVYLASKRALDSLVRSFHVEHPTVAFTSYFVGATATDIDGSGVEPFLDTWVQRGHVNVTNVLFPEDHGRAVVNILSLGDRVLIDRIGVRPRTLPNGPLIL